MEEFDVIFQAVFSVCLEVTLFTLMNLSLALVHVFHVGQQTSSRGQLHTTYFTLQIVRFRKVGCLRVVLQRVMAPEYLIADITVDSPTLVGELDMGLQMTLVRCLERAQFTAVSNPIVNGCNMGT